MNQRRYIIVSPQQPFMLDCRLNDPNVLIELYRGKQISEDSRQKVDPQTDPLVTQNGQVFTIDVSTLTFGSNMEFECRAINTDDEVVRQKTVILEKVRGLTLEVDELPSFTTDKANHHLIAAGKWQPTCNWNCNEVLK